MMFYPPPTPKPFSKDWSFEGWERENIEWHRKNARAAIITFGILWTGIAVCFAMFGRMLLAIALAWP